MRLLTILILFVAGITLTTAFLQYCPPSYFFDAQHCQKCQTNCICTIENTCSSCVQGFTRYKDQCIQCPQATGVYGQCSGCCSRETGTVLACTDCTVVPNKYSFLFSGRCILSQGCFQVDSHGFCTQCRTGYYQTNNLCYSCDASCSTCTDSTNCLTCADGYYWKVNHGGLCTQCPNGCATCLQSSSCLSCLQSYYKYNDHCLQCPTDCLQCNDGSTCTSCSAGILVTNLCIRCNDLTYGGSTGCLTCAENNNFIKCEQCDDRYFLDASTGVCRLCASSITGAERCRDQNTPTQCLNDVDVTLINRYYLVGISCIRNTKSCKKIADVQGNCAQCYSNYILSATSTCQLCPFTGCKISNRTVVSNVCTCSQCDTGYYLPAGQVICQTCTTGNCAYCPNNVCSKCLTGYYLSAGSCVAAVVGNCLVLASATTCNQCNDLYYLGSDALCYHCQLNCNKCTGRFNCKQCNPGYYLDSTACVKLPLNCYSFDITKKTCILCSHGYFLFQGFCLQCTVQSGTLASCQGLCPIDYYIQDLLNVKVNYATYQQAYLLLILTIALLLMV